MKIFIRLRVNGNFMLTLYCETNLNFTTMSTAVKKTLNNQPFDPKTMFINSKGELKRLSKAGIWWRENTEPLIIVKDKNAIYK